MTESKEIRRCNNCDRPDTEAIILPILLPPLIVKTPLELCPECLRQAIDDSKKSGKAAQ